MADAPREGHQGRGQRLGKERRRERHRTGQERSRCGGRGGEDQLAMLVLLLALAAPLAQARAAARRGNRGGCGCACHMGQLAVLSAADMPKGRVVLDLGHRSAQHAHRQERRQPSDERSPHPANEAAAEEASTDGDAWQR